ncbi:MAG: hypothetical protein K2O40_15240 [Lachnospiraceae bacterium]|nr:hypothetical protein [Lachnospiraceae bacterium]
MEAELPEKLRRMIGQGGFRIAWVCGNLKSHKKYYYALQEFQDAVVITVDDDKIYAETMICDLMESYKRFPDSVSARIARIILKRSETLEQYVKWEKEEKIEECKDVPRMDLCAIGAGGVCYSPRLVNKNWFHKETIMKVAGDYDDLWLKYSEIISNIPVVYTKPSQKDITIDDSQICRLSANNLYGSGNDKCISKILVLLKERYADCYEKWFSNLMTREEYLMEKKKYYAGVFNTVFDKVGNMPVYFYGAGKTARHVLRILADLGLTQRITAIVVSDKAGNPSGLYDLQVKSLSELDTSRKFGVIFGVDEANQKEIMDRLTAYNYQNIELDTRVIASCYK